MSFFNVKGIVKLDYSDLFRLTRRANTKVVENIEILRNLDEKVLLGNISQQSYTR